MADADWPATDLVASFFTLSGGGFGEPPRHAFAERCEAAAAAGFAGIGLHADDLPRTVAAGLDVGGMRAVLAGTGLRLVEIEFLGGWALDVDDAGSPSERTVRRRSRRWPTRSAAGTSAPGSSARRRPRPRTRPRRGCGALADRLAGRGLLVAAGGVPLVGAARRRHRASSCCAGPARRTPG